MKITFAMEQIMNGGGPRNIYVLSKELKQNGFRSEVSNLFDIRLMPIHIFSSIAKSINYFGADVRFPHKSFSMLNMMLVMGSWVLESYLSLPFLVAQYGTEPLTLYSECMSSDVIVATSWQTVRPVLKASEMLNIPALYFVQADEGLFYRKSFFSSLASRTYKFGIPMFTHSKTLPAHFKSKYGVDVDYVGFGIDHENFKANGGSLSRRIFTIARTERLKGFDLFVSALNLLWKQRQDFEVLIAGSKKAVSEERVEFPYEFVGWIRDDGVLAKYYEGSIFVSTGKGEALPMPPLEAMACGASVVATDQVGIREYAENGINSLLVPIGDHVALSSAISYLLDNEDFRQTLVINGIETSKRYSWDQVVSRFAHLLQCKLS